MTWYTKECITILDKKPIHGLFYLDGDQYSRVLERDATVGMKYPKIGFPSGLSYEVYHLGEKDLWVHLFGDITVPLFADRDRAFNHLKTLITPTNHVAYFVHPVDAEGILIWSTTERERLLVTYDNSMRLIEDVQGVSGTVGAYQVRGRTYHLP